MTTEASHTNTDIFVLDIDRIEVGDIILTSERKLRSKTIRLVTKSDFSHAMICVGPASYIHSVGKGVEIANPQRDAFDSRDRVQVMRYNGENRSKIAHAAASFARKKVGTEYSVPEAVATKLTSARKNLTNRQFCSRLVAQAYAHAGVKLVSDPDYCSPEELASSSHLTIVPLSTREADDGDRFLLNEGKGTLNRQSEIINGLLKSAREITGIDIQTLDQITEHLLQDDSHDEALTKALKASGYLTIWKMDVDKNPWRYSAELLLQMDISKEEIRKCALREIELSKVDVTRFYQTAESHRNLLKVVDRAYFRVELELFEHLAALHVKRYQAATSVLEQTSRN